MVQRTALKATLVTWWRRLVDLFGRSLTSSQTYLSGHVFPNLWIVYHAVMAVVPVLDYPECF